MFPIRFIMVCHNWKYRAVLTQVCNFIHHIVQIAEGAVVLNTNPHIWHWRVGTKCKKVCGQEKKILSSFLKRKQNKEKGNTKSGAALFFAIGLVPCRWKSCTSVDAESWPPPQVRQSASKPCLLSARQPPLEIRCRRLFRCMFRPVP